MKGTELIQAIKEESVMEVISGKYYYLIESTTLDNLAELINFESMVLEENHKQLQRLLGVKEG